jgi:aspartyl-tRNA(Asn)/glutamyl-tRNA(Gln) amidotransferase subunit A
MAALHELGLGAAAAALAQGECSARELCAALLARQEQLEPRIGAFTRREPESLLAAAAAADARRRAGAALSAWDGVPVAVKDNIAVAGEPCGCASRILAGYTAPFDATVTARLRRAGFLFCGRTNMDEFAMGSSTENSGLHPTANPWQLECVPGGSSGGSAAAVAAGMAPAALGSDTGGSIRQPAAFCGVVGLKPTYGLVSRYGLVAYASSLDQVGPLTRSVADAAHLLDVLAGHDPLDSSSLPGAHGHHAAALAEEVGVRGLRIGLPAEYFAAPGLDPEVRRAVEGTAAALEGAGASLRPVSLPSLKYAIACYYIIATAEASANLARFDGIRYGARAADGAELLDTYRRSRSRGFGAEVKRRIILGTYVLSSGYYDAYYLRAQKVRTLIRNDFRRVFADCDLILSPTAPTAAWRRGAITDPLAMYLADIYTIAVNLAGICALSLPCGFTRAGLPVGLQLMGPALGERPLLRAAQACEQASGLGGRIAEVRP